MEEGWKMKILWATKIGAPDYEEQLITEVEARIEAASTWARNNGFDRLRISEFNGEKPNFVKAIAV